MKLFAAVLVFAVVFTAVESVINGGAASTGGPVSAAVGVINGQKGTPAPAVAGGGGRGLVMQSSATLTPGGRAPGVL